MGYPNYNRIGVIEERLVVPKFALACDGSTLDSISNPEYKNLINHLRSVEENGNYPYRVSPDNLNQAYLPDFRDMFLRGKSETREIGSFEDHQMEDHKHVDLGHKHTSHGHVSIGIAGGGGVEQPRVSGSLDTSTDFADLSSPVNPIDKSNDRKIGEETRPKNIAIYYVIYYN